MASPNKDILIVTGGGSGIGLACLRGFLEVNKNNQATLVDKIISMEIRNELEKDFGSSRVLFVE
jgi:NAD(P)-dependent dehydrogenase (short-subunit alcohol dehydrogenase family)